MSAINPQPTLNFSDNNLTIDGEADAMAAADLRQRGEALLAGAKGDITVDLAKLASASSAERLCWPGPKATSPWIWLSWPALAVRCCQYFCVGNGSPASAR